LNAGIKAVIRDKNTYLPTENPEEWKKKEAGYLSCLFFN
jgi:hypothetical protein